jgi:iodotyrosine deiodinase
MAFALSEVFQLDKVTSHEERFIPLEFERLAPEEEIARASLFLALMKKRRTVRDFSPEPVPFELIELAIETAGASPSGANQQPWRFVVVRDQKVKHLIRLAAEEEERANYQHRFPEEWKEALAPLGTDWHKEFLESAPYLIVVFKASYGQIPSPVEDGTTVKSKHYYVNESVGIAVGILLAALHNAGLATLTHTPSPMGFLSEILNRPKNEKPYLLIPVGYPATGALVPDIRKKPLDEIMVVV